MPNRREVPRQPAVPLRAGHLHHGRDASRNPLGVRTHSRVRELRGPHGSAGTGAAHITDAQRPATRSRRGKVPTGFVRSDEGFLKPNLDPEYEDVETGFFDIVNELERLEDGASYRSVAEGEDGIPNVTRQTLSTIHQDEERRRWYLEAKADDDRVEEALQDVAVE